MSIRLDFTQEGALVCRRREDNALVVAAAHLGSRCAVFAWDGRDEESRGLLAIMEKEEELRNFEWLSFRDGLGVDGSLTGPLLHSTPYSVWCNHYQWHLRPKLPKPFCRTLLFWGNTPCAWSNGTYG